MIENNVHVVSGVFLTLVEVMAVNDISLLKGPKDQVNLDSTSQDKNISRWTS